MTDPDSLMLRARNRFLQGFNAQAAVSQDQAPIASACPASAMFASVASTTGTNMVVSFAALVSSAATIT